jgi:hypothetical protein
MPMVVVVKENKLIYCPILPSNNISSRDIHTNKKIILGLIDCDKGYQLLAHGRWFSPGTLASSTTKTDRHDIAEVLLKVALHTKNQSINQSKDNLLFFT